MTTTPIRSRFGRLLAAIALCAGLFATSAHAELYNGTPTRVIGPFASGQASPVPGGGWMASDDRVVGASLGGQGGWSIPCSPAKYDEGISNAVVRSGLQSWRVSNWFHEGCVNTVLTPAFASVAESAGPTGTVVSSFWFRVPSSNSGLHVSASLSDAPGQRMTYAAIRDDAGTLTVQVVGIPQGAGFMGTPLPAPFDDAGVEYDIRSSGVLAHDAWYQLRVSASLQIGPRDDQVAYEVINSANVVVWSSGPMASWEDAYLAGAFAPASTKVTISRLAFRIVENPDNLSNRNPGATYALNRPLGVYLDDLNVSPGGGAALNVGFEGDRYISATGTDSGTCATATPASARCRTLAYALSVAQPYNRIHVAAGGTYTGTSVVTKAGIQILGEGSPKPVIRQDIGAANQRLILVNNVRNVKIDGLDFQADKSYVGAGILAMGDVEGLVISNNQFSQSQSAGASTYGLTNAIAINYVNDNAGGLPVVDGSTVLIENNTVLGSGTLFRAGIQMDRSLGIIRNNVITSGTQDITVRFPTYVAGRSSSTKVTINNNESLGRGVQLTSPNAGGVTAVEFLNNTVSAVAGYPGGADAYASVAGNPADFSLMRLINNPQGIPLTISGNTFSGHAGNYRGVLVQNYPGIVLTGNTFTPKSTATDFVSLVLSSKELTTDNPPSAPLALSIDARGNTFNGSSNDFVGRAVEFINDHDASGAASPGSLSFGGAMGDANNFSGSHRWYFRLDDRNCDFATGGAGNCGALNYPGVNANVPPTQIRPFRFNVSATQNLFGGVAPANPAQTEIRSRTYDQLANLVLGIVSYNVATDQPVVYVDTAWSANVYGDPLTFTSVAAGSVPVQFGINAFATIPSALMHVQTAGTVHVAKGSYVDPVVVDKQVQVIGDGEGASAATGTILVGGIAVAGSGASAAAADRLSINNLRVAKTGPGSVGINFSANASHISLQNVTVTGAVTAGIQFAGVTLDDIVLDHVTATANPGLGLRGATTTRASNVTISHSEFSDNGAGIILFGATNSGDGQITDWTISDSRLLRNDNADASAFGGGLWLKTGGTGSKIDGFVIQRSQFIDNGSSAALNRTGITIRARPGTTLTNVSICDNNIFADTVTPGTQITGINVFDQTGNTGYAPVTVCNDNDFAGVPVSISGGEQNAATSTQPIVNITGGPIANTQQINGYVKRASDQATFATISSALADAGTLAGETILVPIGQYSENVVITQNGLTLQGAGIAAGTATILDGTGKSGSGITVAPGVTGVTIDGLHVRDFVAIGSDSGACVFGAMSNSGLRITNSRIENCAGGRGGVFLAGGGAIDNVTITGNQITATDGRAIVIWDGFKTHITISNNTISNITGCCGIELQDGTASGVKVEGNTLTNIGDSAMAMNGLTSGAGPNLIRNNTISLAKRFGIEIKLPNGTGSTDETSDGAIIVSGNTVMRTGTLTDVRDIGGIVVIRRAFITGQGYADIPTGVVIRNNTISGWAQPGAGTGHGIVVEGTQMRVLNNTLSGNDIDVQRQAGNDGYVANAAGDSDQSLFNAYFSRGNSPQTCAVVTGAVAVDIQAPGNPVSMEPIASNATTGRFYCTVQSAIDDAATVSGNTIQVYDGTTVAEQVLVNKTLRITEEPGNLAPRAKFVAPATVSGLALFRVSAPNVEIDNLDFVVDLSRVGEAIRTVGGTAAGDPSGITIHHNAIVATASSGSFVAYGRRNALSLNLSSSSGYAPAGEQVVNLSVAVSNNTIGGTQDWDSGTAGNQPAYFRSAIGLDQGAGTISGNSLRGRDYDGFIRFSNGAGLTVGPGNSFNGGGLYLGDGIVPVSVTGNSFAADRTLLPFADFALPVGAAKWGDLGLSAVRLVNAGPVTLATNIFTDQTNSVFAQNVGALTLTSNTFNVPTHGGQFRHVIVSTKVMSSGSATVTQAPIGVSATSNTFVGGPGTPATAIELLNHDSDNASYAPLSFGGASVGAAPNTFTGNFTYYFRLDGSSGPSTGVAEPYLSNYGYASTPATAMAPFGNATPIQAIDNLFEGIAPDAMDAAQIAALQARTYHDDPLAPESPAAPAAMGRVEYGFAPMSFATATTVTSAMPAHGLVGAPVTVSVAVTTSAFGGTPSGTVTVTGAPDGGSCTFAYPAATSCPLMAGFASSGLKMITAQFTDGVAADSTSAAVTYQVFTNTPGGGTTEVSACTAPACSPTATDNDYTRINNALQLVQTGDTLVLEGAFNWNEPNAKASWAANNYSMLAPANRGGVTITGVRSDNGTSTNIDDDVFGTSIAANSTGLVFANTVRFIRALPGTYTNWTIKDLHLVGFERPIAMVGWDDDDGGYPGIPTTAFNGVQVTNNWIEMSNARLVANGSNIAVSFGPGANIHVNQNRINIPGNRDASSQAASTYGFLNYTTGGAFYTGLQLNQNHFVVGAPAVVTTPERIIPIWENSNNNDPAASLQIVGNRLISNDTALIPANKLRRVAIMSNHASSNLLISGNTASGWGYGFSYMANDILGYVPDITGTGDGVLLTGNDFHDNSVGIRSIGTNVGVTAHFNRLVGNTTAGVVNSGTGGGTFDAANNWWGSNNAPGGVGSDAASGTATTTPWLKLSIAAAPTSIPANGTPSVITTQLVRNTDSAIPAGIAAFPTATYGYVTSIGAVAPVTDTQSGGLAHSSLTSSTVGGALVTTSLDYGTASTNVLVTNAVGPPNTVTLTPSATPSAGDNDYTRVNNAVQALTNSTTLILSGTFNWTETNAAISWSKGSDGIAGNGDDYTIEPPRNLDGVTITAATPGAATITGPGDLAVVNLEGVFSLYGGSFRNWTISNLRLDGFDLPLGMFHDGAPADAFLNLRVLDNRFTVAADLNVIAAPADANQNIGIHYSFGKNQEFARNEFVLDASGLSSGANSATTVAMQSTTSGNGYYDGLRIHDNTIRLVGTVAVDPAKLYGIWENDQNFTVPSDMQISNNQFLNQTGSAAPAGNLWRGFMLTSQSVGAKQVVYRNNTVRGASLGFTTYIGGYTPGASSLPTLIEGNTLVDNLTAIRVQSDNGNAKVTAQFNRIVGSGVGVEQINATADARNNWWGCNAGPSAVGCTSTLGTPTTAPSLKLAISASPTSFVAGTPSGSTIVTTLVNNINNLIPIGIGAFPTASYDYASSLGVMTPVLVTQSGGLAQSTLTSSSAGGALVMTALDNGTATTNVLVTNAVGPPNTVTITPAATPSAGDNDYTRINNAVQAATSGTTIMLNGMFNWAETNALASWSRGSDGIDASGGGDDYAIEPPRNLIGVTITASAPGAATIQGPGDLASANLEGVFSLYGGSFKNWTISNLTINDFDLAIGMFNSGGPIDAFEGVKVVDNTIRIAADLSTSVAPVDVNQNIGLHYSFGKNQEIGNNVFLAPANGVNDGANTSVSVAMQSNTSGAGAYDGLRIHDNLIQLTGIVGAAPPRIYGIWENDQSFTNPSDMQIDNNSFLNQTGSPAPAGNLWRGFILTSQSVAPKQVVYRNNTVRGASLGFTTILGSYTPGASSAATQIIGNTLIDNLIAIRANSDNGEAKINAQFNRIVGTGVGVEQGSAVVNAANNWWGCNGGPAASNCTTIVGTPMVTPWLKLAVVASPTSFAAGTPTGSSITTTLVGNTTNTVPLGMGDFPTASYGFATSLGLMSSTAVVQPDGLAQSTLTSATAGGALVTTTLDYGTASTNVLVTNAVGPPNTVTITPATSPTAADNDYTRINNAVQALANDTTLTLVGQFDWSPNGQRDPLSNPDTSSYAYQSWLNGTIGVSGSTTGWSIIPPRGLSGVTITAAMKGGASVGGGATIRGPGDIATGNLEGVLSLGGGTYHEWTISNLELSGFDHPIGMHHTASGPADAFEGVAITDNVFRLPADGPDANQNIGLHFAFGKGQTIAENEFYLDASGLTMVGMQSETSGGDLYDGLLIQNNTIHLIGTPPAIPTTVIGIWENNQGFTVPAAIEISGNRFLNETNTPAPSGVTWRAFQMTSQSVGSKQVVYRNNRVDGASVAFTTITGSYTFEPGAGSLPTVIEGNTILNSGVAIRAVAQPGFNARIDAHFNRIDGSGTGILQSNATVNATNNWWGCNDGPGSAGCSTLSSSGTGTQVASPWLTLSLASDTPIVGAGGLALLTASVNGNSDGDDLSGTTAFPGGTSIAFVDNTAATLASTTALTGSTPSMRGLGGNTLSNIQTTTTVTATLDNQPVSTTINVNQVSLNAEVPVAGVVNISTAAFPLTITNLGAPLSEDAKVYVSVARNPLATFNAADLVLQYEYPAGSNNWITVVLASTADTLTGSIPVPQALLVSGVLAVNLRATSQVAGTLEFFAILVGDTSNALYSSDGGSVVVVEQSDVTIQAVSGSPQTAPVGSAYAAPLVVRAITTVGQLPLANLPVSFIAPPANASVTYASASGVTDADGELSSGIVTANATAGAVTTASAAIGTAVCSGASCSVAFALTNTATSPASISVISSSPSQPVNTASAYTLTATVLDASSNPVNGVSVSFTAPSSGASVLPSSVSVLTNAAGQAVYALAANSIAGNFSVVASSATSSGPITAAVSLTNTAAAFDHLVIVSGSGQTAPVGSPFATALVVRAEDASNNPVSGVVVTFAGSGGGADASLTPGSVTTAANGLASSSATANAIAGAYTVTATSSANAIAFALTNTATAPASIALSAGDISSVVNTAFDTNTLCAAVVDASANPLAGVSVTFAAPASGTGASFAPNPVLTNAAGQACTTATANSFAGSYAVTAIVAASPTSLASAPVTLTNTTAAAASLVVVSGSPQTGIVNSPFAAPLVVQVNDGSGNPISGQVVSFSAVAGSGGQSATLSAPAATGANGRTQVIATANNFVGSYTVIATVSGVPVATFYLDNQVSASNATLAMAGDAVGVVTLPSSAAKYSLSSATTTLTGPAPTENVIAHLTINRAGGTLAGDLAIDYRATTQEFAACTAATPSGFWCPLTLTASGSSLTSTFGPAAGFPLTNGAVSTFRTRYASGGQYTVTTTLDGVGSAQTYATGILMVNVAELDLAGTPGTATGNTGVAIDTAVGLLNSGTAAVSTATAAPNNQNVVGEFTITPASGSVLPADVEVRYFNALTSSYDVITLSASGSGVKGNFGGAGFPVAAGYSATSLFRSTFLTAGTYTVSTRIIGATTATDVFAATSQTATVTASSSTIAIDPASLSQTYNTLAHPVIVSTMPAGLAYSLSYSGVTPTVYPTSSAPPTDAGSYAVVATITAPGYSGVANGTLTIAKAASTVSIAGPLLQDFGSTQPLTATASPISTGSVSITYNGSATAPTAVGSYAVVATLVDPNYNGSATATLVVQDAANVAITFSAPEMALVTPSTAPFSAQTLYSGTLSNSGGSTSQKVHYRITAVRIDDGNGMAGLPPVIDADDVEVCLYDPSGYAAQAGAHRNCPVDYQSLFISRSTGSLNGRAAVSFRYPNLAANDILLPSTGASSLPLPPTLFQFKRGEYRVQVDVVGADDSTIYATASDTTSVPQAAIAYNGATSGPTEQALLSTTTLSNTGGRVVGNVIVRITLSDAAAAPLTAGDAEFAYLDGSSFVTLPWTVSGTNLVTEFGPPIVGFELEDGHNQSTAGRGIFHRAGSYGLLYEVVDIATGTVIHATEQKALMIGPNIVNFTLSDLDQVYDGTPRPVTVTPASVPHSVVYDASCPAVAPAATPANQVAPTDAGSYCVYVNALGSYVGNASGTLVVAKAAAPVSLTGAVAGTVSRTYAASVPQTVLATTPVTLGSGGNIAVSYNGSSTPPIDAGSYSLVATIVDTNYQGSTTGTLVISIAGGATITLDGGSPINRSYTGSQQAPVTATTNPASIAYTVTYVGSGPTVYPLTSTPPTAVGSYAVVATTADANYAPVSASGTLVVANASAATLAFTATPSSLAVNATSITSATLANTGGPIGENVLVRFTITRNVAGLVPSDLALRYDAGGLQPLGLIQSGSSLVGYLGPQPGGFPMPASFSGGTAGDAVFHVAGVYSLTLDLVGVSTSTVFATTSSTVTVTQTTGTITINPSTLTAVYNGSPHPVTVTTNPAGLAYTLSYAGGPTAPTNAGIYTVLATLTDPNYSGSDNQLLTITKAVSPVTFAGSTNVVYTGLAQSPLTAALAQEPGNAAACTIAYTPVAAPTNVGTYTATATCNGSNYTGSASTTLTISASPATVTLSNLAQTFDGTPRPVTVTTNPLGLTTSVTYGGSATVPTNAGTYNVVATITSAGYSGTTSGTLIVDKAVATVTIGNLTHVYNGLAKAATAVTTPIGVPVTFTYNGGTALPVNAGSYTVVATASNGNYSGTATATLTIAKAVATVTLSDLSQTYNGTPRSATVTTAPSGLAVSVSYNGNAVPPLAVGSYAVVASIVDTNYQGSNSGTLVIGQGAATVTLTNLSQAYTGSPISASAITSPAGLAVSLSYNGSPTPPTAVGSYTVQATITDASYSGSVSATLTITPATAAISVGNLSQVYDGAPKAVSVTTTPTGLPRTISYDGSAIPPSAVGSYAVLVTVTDPNYTGTASATLTITKATAVVSLSNLSQIYDGSPRPVTVATTPNGLTVAVTYDGSTTPPTSTGTYAVVATVNDATYQGTASGTLVVTNGNATVTLSNLAQTYDGMPRSVTVTTNPLGLTTTVTYNGSSSVPINAGSYTVVATVTSAGYSGSGAGTLVIGKATATVTLGSLSQTYDGSARTVTASTTPGGLTVNLSYAGSPTAPVNAGTYAVTGTISDANYQGSASASLVVAKATAPVLLGGLSQIYDGTPKSASATTNPTGLSVDFTYAGSPTPPTNAGSYAVVATITSSGYTGTASGTLIISKATATVTLGSLNPTYDGSPKPATATTSPTGLAVTYSYDGSPTAPTNAGTYLVVGTVTDSNYSGTASATLTIAKAAATVTLSGLSQAYNGSPRPVVVTTVPAGLSNSVTYDGSATAPTAVGTYAVSATVTNPNYTGSAVGTLQVTAGTANLIAANGPTSYAGTVSQPVAGPLPSVLVTDAGGNPVAGIVVTFTAGASSGSLSGATQTTASNGVATLGGWVLGPSAPTQTVTATGSGMPGSVLFSATAGGSVSLSVSIDSGRQYVRAGQSISHLVAIGNSGSLLATGVTIASVLPAELDPTSLQWICVASAGSSCGSASAGTGNLPTTVNIAAGGNLSFVLTGTVLPGPTDVLSVSVTATRPVGTIGSNGSATDSTQVVIFRDGFEQGGDGAQWPTATGGELRSVSIDDGRIIVVDLDHALLSPGRITTLARGAGGSFRVEASWIDGQVWLRLVARNGDRETSSDWTVVNASQTRFALSYEAGANATATLSLVCGSVTLEQSIAATAAMTVYASGFAGDGIGLD